MSSTALLRNIPLSASFLKTLHAFLSFDVCLDLKASMLLLRDSKASSVLSPFFSFLSASCSIHSRGGFLNAPEGREREGEERRGEEKEGEKKEKGEINSRADFRLPPRGGRGGNSRADFRPPPREREEGGGGEERGGKGGGEKGEGRDNFKGRFPAAPERRGEGRNSRADFRPPPRGERREGRGEGEEGEKKEKREIQGRISGRPREESGGEIQEGGGGEERGGKGGGEKEGEINSRADFRLPLR